MKANKLRLSKLTIRNMTTPESSQALQDLQSPQMQEIGGARAAGEKFASFTCAIIGCALGISIGLSCVFCRAGK